MNIYDIKVLDRKKQEVSMSDYKDKGFEVLDFPCDQFGHQALGTDEEINKLL